MNNELVQKFYDLLDEGVKRADNIRAKYDNEMLCIREVQAEMSAFTKEKDLPKIAKEVIDTYPEKTYEVKRRIIAFMGEGKKLEDSILARTTF